MRQVGVERSTVCFAVPSQEQPAATTAAGAGSHRAGQKEKKPSQLETERTSEEQKGGMDREEKLQFSKFCNNRISYSSRRHECSSSSGRKQSEAFDNTAAESSSAAATTAAVAQATTAADRMHPLQDYSSGSSFIRRNNSSSGCWGLEQQSL